MHSLKVPAFFLGKHTPIHIMPTLCVSLTEHTYMPKVVKPREDRVTTVTVPAFRARQKRYHHHIDTFATIGTGAGLDALAAIEIFSPKKVMITDIHQDVVESALQNIRDNVLDNNAFVLLSGVGDLGEPLVASDQRYDLVYENLPNIPLLEGKELDERMNSSSFVKTNLVAGPLAKQHLLELHAQILMQSKDFLSTHGHVLSSIGARVPLAAILSMAKEAGCQADILLYTRKIQTEAEDVISGYAYHESLGKGPFHFYPVPIVEALFSEYDSAAASSHAYEIEKMIEPHRISATQALQLLKEEGTPFAHTVVVISSRPALY